MFLRFVVTNHRSLKDEVELSFLSTARKDEPLLRFESPHLPHGVLPAVGVWGGNATGKSNLIDALTFMRWAVKDSQNRWGPTDPILWSPWRLRTAPEDPPTTLELELLLDGDRYAYGFTFRSTGILEEWLFRWETARRQVLFHRSTDETPAWYFGPSFPGPKTRITDTVRPNSLFLSAAAQANHPLALPVYRKIVDGIIPARGIRLSGYPTFHRDHPLLSEAFRPTLLRLLREADLGVHDVIPEDLDPDLPVEAETLLPPPLVERYRTRLEDQRRLRLVRGEDATWSLEPQDESRGTQVLLARLSDVVVALRAGALLVVDEIDTSLHPDLCRALLQIFTTERSNRAGAQILFTTHDRDLLNHLRSDEITLLDKRADGSTRLAAASDYVRSRTDMATAHRTGRIGGIPILGDLAATLEIQ